MKIKAYSYLRFSTPDQIKGDSFRRQMELTRKYAKKKDLDLDESLTFQDLGISAYRGKNIREGALGAFVDALSKGIIATGSYLLVESLDRLSRNKVHEAYLQFTDILNRGVNIVTLQDEKCYTKDSVNDNFGDLLISLATMFRAHEESQTKSNRGKAAWKNKRKLARDSGIKLTARAPAWLILDKKSGKFLIRKDRAKIINEIFDLTMGGLGKQLIASRFNQKHVPTFGRSTGWQPSYIQKILDNEAVIGRLQPMKTIHIDGKRKRVPDGDVIENYFPPVIEIKTFLKARQLRSNRKIGGGRKGKKFSNLFTGLAKCGLCGAPMHYVSKGKTRKGGVYLVCAKARNRMGCPYYSWRYTAVQSVLIQGLNEIDFRELYPTMFQSIHKKLRETENRHLIKKEELKNIDRQLANVASVLADHPNSSTMQAKLVRLEESKIAIEQEIKDLNRTLSEKQYGLTKSAEGLDEALEKLLQAEEKGDIDELLILRSRLHQLLLRCIDSIKLTPAQGEKEPTNGAELHGIVEVAFKEIEGHYRKFYFEKGQNNAYGYKVVNGVEDPHTHHIDIKWPPEGVFMMGGFLEPYVLG